MDDEPQGTVERMEREGKARGRSYAADLLIIGAREIRRLRLEVATLRRYGNKDCTAMADAALEQKRTAGKGPWED